MRYIREILQEEEGERERQRERERNVKDKSRLKKNSGTSHYGEGDLKMRWANKIH